jgi:hypothetical protein
MMSLGLRGGRPQGNTSTFEPRARGGPPQNPKPKNEQHPNTVLTQSYRMETGRTMTGTRLHSRCILLCMVDAQENLEYSQGADPPPGTSPLKFHRVCQRR